MWKITNDILSMCVRVSFPIASFLVPKILTDNL